MVKIISLMALLSLTLSVCCQNLSMGVGARANTNFVDYRSEYNFDILNNAGDTLKLKTIPNSNAVNLATGLSFPIYARFTSKKNWWIQLNYGYEIWRLGTVGFSTPTDYAIRNSAQARLNNLPDSIYSSEDKEELRDVFLEDELEEGTIDLESFERVQYNKLSFAFGSSFNRKGATTFYYGAGFDYYTTSTVESYQGLVYDNEDVSFLHQIIEALPKLESNIISPFVNFGIEKQNIRFGLDLTFYPGPVFGEHQVRNDNLVGFPSATQSNELSSQLVRSITSVGFNLNYTLFNQNFNQAISADKKNVLDPLVIGRYRQKPKLLQFGMALNFPSFSDRGWSVIDDFELPNENDIVLYNDSLKAKGDTYLSGRLFQSNPEEDYAEILDYMYLEKQDEEMFVNDDGEIDTSFLTTTVFLDWGTINSIVKSPKVSGFVRVNLHELFSADINMGYQNHTYGIAAYETVSETVGEETNIQTRKLVYQENFHELSLGLNAYTQKHINNISQLGFHVGVNYNLWFNGVFDIEAGGINDSELLEDFHDYNTGQLEGQNDPTYEEAEEWNTNINSDADKGVFTKEDYYNYNYNAQNQANSYHTDYSPYLINDIKKRSYFEMRFGIDYYIENLKFNLYAERSLLRNNTMYSSLFTVGMGVSLFLN